MYLNFQSYKKKYKKYKNKYQILKSNIGGNCDRLPNPEEDDLITTQNLLDLCPEERITIQNKCYEVRSLYRWIITDNHNILPSIQTEITVEEKQRLIQAYEALSKIPNILTRDKLIQIYPNLLQVTRIDLTRKGYTDIALGTFSNLPNLQYLYLDNNQIRKLQSNIFNNLPELRLLYLNANKIKELQPGMFNNLPNLDVLGLENNQIRELQPNIFNNLPALEYLILENNQIQELLPGVFNNLPALKHLDLENNQIQELQPHSYYGLSYRAVISI
jgi:Leucine-rich repeat (LRR) protein